MRLFFRFACIIAIVLIACAPLAISPAQAAPSQVQATLSSPQPKSQAFAFPPVITPNDFTDGFVFPFSSERGLTQADFITLMEKPGGKPYFELLRFAYNEIYARHGHIFRDAELKAHYSSCAWYRPLKKETKLSELEDSNVALIKAMLRGIEGEMAPVAMPQGTKAPTSVYNINIGKETMFYNTEAGALYDFRLIAEPIGKEGSAAFLRQNSKYENILYGHGGKQLTRSIGRWYEFGAKDSLVSYIWQDKKMVITLLNPETLCPIASISLPRSSIHGWVELNDEEYIFISLPNKRYIVNESGKYRVIDQHGETLRALPFTQVGYRAPNGGFGNEFLGECDQFDGSVRITVMDANRRWGAIDENFQLIIPCNFDEPLLFQEGYAQLERPLRRYVDFSGNFAEQQPGPKNVSISSRLSGTRFIGQLPEANHWEAPYGLADNNGSWLLEPEFDYIYAISNDRLRGSKKMYNVIRFGLYDLDGNEILPAKYKWIRPCGDLYEAVEGDIRGLIDETGNWIVRIPIHMFLIDD